MDSERVNRMQQGDYSPISDEIPEPQNGNGERVDNSLSKREALGNEQREATARTRTHQQQAIFRFLAHSLTTFGHETAASVIGLISVRIFAPFSRGFRGAPIAP